MMTSDEILWQALGISDRVAIVDGRDGATYGMIRRGDTVQRFNEAGIFYGEDLARLNDAAGNTAELDGAPRFRLQLLPPKPQVGEERAA